MKQIDRLLSNSGIQMQLVLRLWVQFVVGTRPELLLAMAWKEMENDKQVVLAIYVLTPLGAAAEEAKLYRYLKFNTVKTRTHSLYRQGLYWYGALANMREDWFEPLMIAYDKILPQHLQLFEIIGVI